MDSLFSAPAIASIALPTLLLALALFFAWFRQRAARSEDKHEGVDTVAGWPPEVARVLTADERRAHELLRRAFPTHLVLAQVPLARFVRVPLRRSYAEWLQRVGTLSADLLLCDESSRVIAVIDVRAAGESERSRRRHERMSRVLRQAGVHVLVWREGELPSAQEAQAMLTPLLRPGGTAPKAFTTSRPMPLIPVAEMEEILAEGDARAALNHALAGEPVSSGYFDDFEVTLAGR